MSFANTWKRRLQGEGLSGADNHPRRPARFLTEEEVCRYVDEQLHDGLPADWSHHRDAQLLQWRIAPRVCQANALDEDYVLEVTGDYRLFILYYDNAPSGCEGISHSLWTAVVITSEHLSECSLAQAVTHLIQHMDRYRLNIWTLT